MTLYLSQEDGAKGERVKGVGFRLGNRYTNQNIDKIADGIKSRGGSLASEPKDEWGVRAFSLKIRRVQHHDFIEPVGPYFAPLTPVTNGWPTFRFPEITSANS